MVKLRLLLNILVATNTGDQKQRAAFVHGARKVGRQRSALRKSISWCALRYLLAFTCFACLLRGMILS